MTKPCIFTLCYAIVIPGHKSVFRIGFRPGLGLKIRPLAGLRPAGGGGFEAFPIRMRPKSCPEDHFPARKHYCVTLGKSSSRFCREGSANQAPLKAHPKQNDDIVKSFRAPKDRAGTGPNRQLPDESDTQGPKTHTNIKEYFPEAGIDALPANPGHKATFHDRFPIGFGHLLRRSSIRGIFLYVSLCRLRHRWGSPGAVEGGKTNH